MSNRRARTNDDEGTTWSIGSNEGLSRSSHDEGLVFPRESLTKASENIEEYCQVLTTNNDDYFYDGLEEILVRSTDEEIHINEQDDRMSFTREQLVEYQQLTKLLRFVKSGGRCTTILSLALLHDHNLQDQCAFLALKDSSTINVMLNFLEMFDQDLKFNALLVLRDACHNRSLAYEVFRLGGIRTLIDGMLIDHVGIGESCAILLNVLVFRRAKRVCRRSGGISKLISLLDELSEQYQENEQAISALGQVFVLLCQSEKNQYVAIRYGLGRILWKILRDSSRLCSISLVTLLSILLRIPIFRMQMLDNDLVISLLRSLDVSNLDLTRVLCESLYYLSLNSTYISEHHRKALEDLLKQTEDPSIFSSVVSILTESLRTNERLLETMILFVKNPSNVDYFPWILQSLNTLASLPVAVNLFKEQKVYSHFLFYLHEEEHHDLHLILLSILKQAANDPPSAQMIIDNGGLQQLWTLFQLAPLISVRIAAGWVIRRCLASLRVILEAHGELIRSFDGIFYLILDCLSTENLDLLAVTLALIGEIALDEDNREILTDLGVVAKLSQLKSLDNLQLSEAFCDALANLLDSPKNRERFGSRRVFSILKAYLQTNNPTLHRSLTKAIDDLSQIPSNCVLLHDVGISSNLLELIGNGDAPVQERAAHALRNMRRLLEDNRHTVKPSQRNVHRRENMHP